MNANRLQNPRSQTRPRTSRILVIGGLLFSLFSAAPGAWADQRLVDPSNMPGPLKKVEFKQHLDAQLPLDANFRDEMGREVKLGDFFGEKPVILTFVYYDCPMLCTLILNGLAKALAVMKFDPGREYEVVAISIDPAETPAQAAKAESATVKRFGRQETAPGWHFLVGAQDQIDRVAQIAGYGYQFVPETGEFAHASGIVVLTPQGRIAQYYFGIEYSPKDIRLSLVEASQKKIGGVVDEILLYCYRYDPAQGKYTAAVMRIMRIAGGLFAAGLLLFLWLAFRRDRLAERAETPRLGAV